ncbi:MAG TPA: alpha/beta hydrolase [Anaerolineales bacterium]|nr:alpha/beta hydrolase [Anaerolineales bacterium]
MPRLNQRIKLPDGRNLGYDEYGPPEGKPLLYFHGAPSSRLEWPIFSSQALAQKLNLRVIVPDRPGIGLSDYQEGRRIRDWPKDVTALADSLGLERFAMLSYSMGGPYGIATAAAMPKRLTKVGILSGPGPFDQPGLTDGIPEASLRYFEWTRRRPWLARLMLRMFGLMARFAGDKMVANAMAALPEPDRRAMADTEKQQGFLKMLQEATRQGPRGAWKDTLLLISPWDFRPQDISLPVQLWHGEADTNAPPAMARFVAAAIPDSRLQLYPGEGHLSLFVKHAKEILGFMAE